MRRIEFDSLMQRVMQNNAAVFRTQETLAEGCQLIDKSWESFHDVKLKDRSLIWNSDLIETVELENLLINMFFATNVAPSYAPAGKALVSVSLVGLHDNVTDEELVEQVKKELSGWFGEVAVGAWRYMRMYRIGFAQPNQCPPTNFMKDPKLKLGLYICGDYVTSATFDGALVSGRRAVEALLKDRAAVKV